MMRLSTPLNRPSQSQIHPHIRKKTPKGFRCSYFYLLALALFFILLIIIVPSNYFTSQSKEEHSVENQKNDPSSLLLQSIKKFRDMKIAAIKSQSGSSETDLTTATVNTNPTISKDNVIKQDAPPIPIPLPVPLPVLVKEAVRRRKIAYAITITKDGDFQDGAAVLAYSIYLASKNGHEDISLISFVHPNVTTSRPVLKQLGFHIIDGKKTKLRNE